jgi:hypothetical protein
LATVLREKLDAASLRTVEEGNVMARNKCELVALDNEAGKVPHYWLCLHVQIAEHTIRAPAAE